MRCYRLSDQDSEQMQKSLAMKRNATMFLKNHMHVHKQVCSVGQSTISEISLRHQVLFFYRASRWLLTWQLEHINLLNESSDYSQARHSVQKNVIWTTSIGVSIDGPITALFWTVSSSPPRQGTKVALP